MSEIAKEVKTHTYPRVKAVVFKKDGLYSFSLFPTDSHRERFFTPDDLNDLITVSGSAVDFIRNREFDDRQNTDASR